MVKKVYIKKSASQLGVRRAVKTLNVKVPGRAFKVVGKKSTADVIVKKGRPGKRYGGRAQTGSEGKTRIRLREYDIRGKKGRAIESRLVAHELGHAAGLGHKRGRKNLMNPSGRGKKLTKGQKKKLRG